MNTDRVLRALLAWTALTTVLFWLPAIRGAMDGETYEWGLFGFGGKGVAGDYWFPVAAAAVAIVARVLGARGGRFPFHLLLVGWHAFLAVGAFMIARSDPDGLRIQGDTLGFDINLAVVGPVFFGLWAAGALFWVVRDWTRKGPREVPPWTSANTRWTAVLIALLPVQYVFLHYGEPDSMADKIGVVMTVLQWFLLGTAVRPRGAVPPATPAVKFTIAPDRAR
jgi:hypothetical protein